MTQMYADILQYNYLTILSALICDICGSNFLGQGLLVRRAGDFADIAGDAIAGEQLAELFDQFQAARDGDFEMGRAGDAV